MTGNRRLPESGRVEAFSDAVFAITITLLVLEIHRPAPDEPELGRRLLERWPDYGAVAVSFVYVGVVWLNHHALFARIRNVDLGLNWINLLILATTALLPFPTGVLAGAFSEGSSGSQEAAVVLYASVGALLSAAWIPVFAYLARRPDLLLDPTSAGVLAKQKSRPLVGVGSYLLAAVLGYCVSPLLALVLFVWMIAYHAITSEGLHANRLAQTFTRTRAPGKDTRARRRLRGEGPSGRGIPSSGFAGFEVWLELERGRRPAGGASGADPPLTRAQKSRSRAASRSDLLLSLYPLRSSARRPTGEFAPPGRSQLHDPRARGDVR